MPQADLLRLVGRPSPQLLAGLGWRALDRACAIAPFFLGYAWLVRDFDAVTLGPAMVLLLAGQLAASHYGQMLGFLGAYDMTISCRRRLIDHAGRLSLGELQGRRIGALAGLLTDDVKRVEDIFTHLAAELVAAAVVPLIFVAGLIWIDWRLALALVAPLPVALLLLLAPGRIFAARVRAKQSLFHDTAGLVVEFVAGITTLRLFGRGGPWLDRLDRRFAGIRRASLAVEAWGAGPVQAYRLCLDLGLVTLLLAGSVVAIGPDPLAWILFALVAPLLLAPLAEAAVFMAELRAMAQAAGRLRGLLDTAPLPEPAVAEANRGTALEFRNVSFRHDRDWVLRDLSFRVAPGEVVAVVGASGAGKTTLLHLLARFHDPQEGSILLGGTDLRRIGSDGVHQALGIVFQDVQLFDGSILDNVRLGRPGADDEAVIAACRAANCDGFVGRLPEGYATRIGENGQRLSGGERQRLSIARALLKDAPILLLDEATASVDPDAQYEIQMALSRLARGRSVIVTAHRLGTIRHADRILVLAAGHLVESGQHDELLAADGPYAALWRAQA